MIIEVASQLLPLFIFRAAPSPVATAGKSGIYDGHYRAHLIISTSKLLALTFLRFCYIYIPYIVYMAFSFMFILLLVPSAALGRFSTLEKWLRESGRAFLFFRQAIRIYSDYQIFNLLNQALSKLDSI